MGNYITKIFGASPVAPLQEHMETCYRTARVLNDFFAAVIASDWARVDELRAHIVALENDADKLKAIIAGKIKHKPKLSYTDSQAEDLAAYFATIK